MYIKNKCLVFHFRQAFDIAVIKKHFEIVKFLTKYVSVKVKNIKDCIKNKDIECLEYLLNFETDKSSGHEYCNMAIIVDDFEILKFLYSKGFKGDDSTCKEAIIKNNLTILKFLYEDFLAINPNHSPIENKIFWLGVNFNFNSSCNSNFVLAIDNNNFDIIKYIYENGCVPNDYTFVKAVKSENEQYISFFIDKIPRINVYNSLISNMKSSWNKDVSESELKFIIKVRELGFEWDPIFYKDIFSLSTLKFLIDNNFEYDLDIFKECRTKNCQEYLTEKFGIVFPPWNSDEW